MRKPAMRSVLMGATLAALALAATASGGTPAWERRIDFAKRLTKDRGYWDLAKVVIGQVLQDPGIKGGEKALVDRAVGEYWVDVIESVRGKDALQRATECLGEARKHFRKYADDPSVTGPGRLEIRKRLAWLSVNQARVLASMLDDADVPKTEHPKLKADAVSTYKVAIKEFEALAAEKKTEEEKAKAGAPKEKDAREKWEKRYNEVRSDHVAVRILLNDTRVELGKFLKKAGADAKEWRPLIESATKDYKAMLYEFSGAAGLAQINVKYAEAIIELGPENDNDALDRLTEVWGGKSAFADNKEVPCRAMHVKASILFRQKKYDEALAALDEMIAARTGGGWEPGQLKADLVGAKVTDILRNLDEGDVERQYNSKALARSYLLEADAYAARAKAAEDAKKPGKDIQRLYRMAYEIGVGVWDARMPMDAKYVNLIELWRKKSGAPPSLSALNIQIAEALDKASRLRDKDPEGSKAEYRRAARLYTEVVARTKQDLDQLRKIWWNVAKCYYAAAEYYSAYHVFTAMSRWFPRPAPQAEDYALSAITAIRMQLDTSVKNMADKAETDFLNSVLREAYLNYEFVTGRPGLAAIAKGRDFRKEKDYRRALEAFLSVPQDSSVYPIARYEVAITYREMFVALPKDEQKAAAGQRVLKSCLDAFQACLDFVKKKLPELKGEDQAEERKRLLDTAVTCVTVYCETLLKDYVSQPAKVVELTTGLKEAFPGIEEAPNYPFIIYARMHAAHALAVGQDLAQATKALATIEEAWKIIRGSPEFKYLATACRMCAVAYNDLAKRLDTQAQKTADATEKADLTKRANAARSRSLDFWLDLLGIAPHQTLATYRYVLFQLDKRESEPKSADYRKIAEIAPKVLSLFKDDEAALDELAQIRILLGSAQARLGQWRDAIPPLEAVDAAYEPSFDARMKKYEADKKRYDENPDKYPAPRRPVRHPLQVQARELLARSYLETKARSKLKEALQIYVDQVNTFPSRQSPKHWEGMYYLIETNRLAGDYQSATGYLYRAVAVIDENVLKTGVGTRKDFVDLAARLAKDVEASADAAAKKSLMPTIQDILKKLGK